jgi:ubiquinol-cytochrome c reductase cytochrome b subunit
VSIALLIGLFATFVMDGLTHLLAATGAVDPIHHGIIGRILTFLYFAFFITMPIWTKLDRTKPVPERVTLHD